MSKLIPSIPDPGLGDTQTMLTTVKALKEAVELLQGVRGPARAPRVFYQIDAPTNAQAIAGDLWINLNDNTMAFFNGEVWTAIA